MSADENNVSAPQADKPSHVVAIGASAGGLEAIEHFFTNMSADSGLAFVVIQHLSPDYKSMMQELISKYTSMPVLMAENDLALKANHVYLIPPNVNLFMRARKFSLEKQDRHGGINLPIDLFFESMAEDINEMSIGIILSGTGSDGTRGLRAIKENLGMIMVQDDASAAFDGMPLSAQSTGLCDFIMPPEKMPDKLLAYVQHPYTTRSKAPELIQNDAGLARLFRLLRERTKLDFQDYKPNTIMRRIERRMTINQFVDLSAYIRYIESSPHEAKQLYQDLLIGVTRFFRDPEVFQALQDKYLPDLFKSKNKGEEVRIWVTPCSTGEEAYTLAIMCREVLDLHNLDLNIKIFATDVDQEAVNRAGSGVYSESIAADIPEGVLARYFQSKGENFVVAPMIRQMIVFAQHNLLRDPPFTNIDLLSCRNLLIYFQSALQIRALETMNFSLHSNGLLVLGTSETLGGMNEFFDTLDSLKKIYRGKGKRQPLSFNMTKLVQYGDNEGQSKSLAITRPLPMHKFVQQEEKVLNRVMNSLSDAQMVPLSIVINELNEILYIFGQDKELLQLPSGKLINDLSKIVHHEMRVPVSTAIQRANKEARQVNYNHIRLNAGDDSSRLINLKVFPVEGKKTDEPLLLITMEDVEQSAPQDPKEVAGEAFNMNEAAEQRIADLEQELQFSQENLQATVEELETSNEELQATNEELLASNEELQSTNEELHSVNEELYTVNAEYQKKISELMIANSDLDNLLDSTTVGSIFLDENLCIRRYTPSVIGIFDILETDIGRPLKSLTSRLNIDLNKIIDRVVDEGRNVDVDAINEDGHEYFVRVQPYLINEKRDSGIVMTFTDLTPHSDRRKILGRDVVWFGDLLSRSGESMLVLNKQMKITEMNENAALMLKATSENLRGMPLRNLLPGLADKIMKFDFFPENALNTTEVIADQEKTLTVITGNDIIDDSSNQAYLIFFRHP